MSQNTKTILSNLFTLTSELSEPTSKLINIEGANETPANQKDLLEGLRENLVNLTEVLGLSVDELTGVEFYSNVPGRTGVNLQAATTVRLARDCQNIVAIKEASGNLEQVDEIIKNKPADFDVISGDDSLTFPMVSCGAVGVISVIGNALPKEFSRMIRLQMRGEYDPARTIHHRFTDLFSLLFVDGNPAGVKAMLSEMGFIQNVLRLPLVPMRINNMQRMSEILKELKI